MTAAPGTSHRDAGVTNHNAAFKEHANMGYASAVAMLMFVRAAAWPAEAAEGR